MKGKRLRRSLWIICAGFAALLSQSRHADAASGGMLALSFPRVGLSNDQWVGGYHCALEGVSIVAIRDVPYIWTIGVTNSRGGRAEIDSGHVLGTGPMGKDPIGDLQDIVLLRHVAHGKKRDSVSVNCKLDVENSHSDDISFINLETRQISVEPIDRIPSPDPPYESGLKWFALSLPTFALTGSERIVMFEVGLKNGRVVSVRNIPDLWSLGATNADAASFTGVHAEMLANSAALGKNDLKLFDRFVTVERHAEDAAYFRIKVKIKIETAPKRYRYVRFNTGQVILTPVSDSGKEGHKGP